MKKSKVLIAMGLCTMLLATGCGKNDTAANKYKDYVDLAKYKGIEVVPTSTEVTDQEIEDMITQNLNNKSEDKEVKGRAVKDGDTVTIDFVGKVDGKEFEGGSAEDYKLVIGSHSFVDDFEEQLILANLALLPNALCIERATSVFPTPESPIKNKDNILCSPILLNTRKDSTISLNSSLNLS